MGWAWAVPADAATGAYGRAALRLTLAVGLLVLGGLVWTRLLDRALTDGAVTAGSAQAGARVGSSALVVGTPLVSVAAVGGMIAADRVWLWPGALGAGLGALAAGTGCAALASAFAPYPVPEAGSNPFRSSSGASARAALAQACVLSATSGLALPGIALFVVGAVWWPPALWAALVVGPLVGAAGLWAGVESGGRLMDARGPEILASARKAS